MKLKDQINDRRPEGIKSKPSQAAWTPEKSGQIGKNSQNSRKT
jgi:hypothetical protein